MTTGHSASMNLLEEISAFCKTENIAESTFGKRAVNDGKFVARLKDGARVTPETWGRVAGFLEKNGWQTLQQPEPGSLHLLPVAGPGTVEDVVHKGDGSKSRNFRFFDNRQKYLLFINTCSEKDIIAGRIGQELAHLHPKPPALRLFDGGMGDGSVLVAVMREMHTRFPTLPFYIAGKEISLEDVRLSLAKMADRLFEHPATVLVIYREDCHFMLDEVIPEPGRARADFDLVIASQPYRARMSAQFKAEKVIGPLTRALGKGGRLIGIHSYGNDPGMEVIQRVWPKEAPFTVDRHDILRALRKWLGKDSRDYNLNAYADSRSIFRYDMHTLPNEVQSSIGTSTLFAAWNGAVYVAQIEDERLSEVVRSGQYLEATEATLKAHNGLWFNDESYVISRKRD